MDSNSDDEPSDLVGEPADDSDTSLEDEPALHPVGVDGDEFSEDGISPVNEAEPATECRWLDHASGLYDAVSHRAQKVNDAVEPFVHERPFEGLVIAAAIGCFIGLLLAGRGPRVVYVRPRH